MAHGAQRQFFQEVGKVYPDIFEWKNVIEIGSLDINGTVRDFFKYCNYVGFDLGAGPGVDYAVQGQDVKYPDNSFDVAVSAECFEHNPAWKETWLNMHRMVKPGGFILMTCAGTGRPEHGTARSDVGSSPLTVDAGWEYYGNLTPEDMKPLEQNWWSYQYYENTVNCDLYAIAHHDEKMAHIPLESVEWQP